MRQFDVLGHVISTLKRHESVRYGWISQDADNCHSEHNMDVTSSLNYCLYLYWQLAKDDDAGERARDAHRDDVQPVERRVQVRMWASLPHHQSHTR